MQRRKLGRNEEWEDCREVQMLAADNSKEEKGEKTSARFRRPLEKILALTWDRRNERTRKRMIKHHTAEAEFLRSNIGKRHLSSQQPKNSEHDNTCVLAPSKFFLWVDDAILTEHIIGNRNLYNSLFRSVLSWHSKNETLALSTWFFSSKMNGEQSFEIQRFSFHRSNSDFSFFKFLFYSQICVWLNLWSHGCFIEFTWKCSKI